MARRHTTAHVFLLLLLGLPACALSHGVGGPPPFGDRPSPVMRDAGVIHPPAHDSGVFLLPDAGPPEVDDAGVAMCPVADAHVVVTASCTITHQDDVTLTSVTPDAATNGIQLHLDLCPGDARDCPCDIGVTNVGTDLAAQLVPEAHVGFDVRAGFANFVALTHSPTCMCDGCPCSLSFLFYAADADPEHAPTVPSDVSFTTGTMLCDAPSSCTSPSWDLAATNNANGATGHVPQGTTQSIGGVNVRSVRDVSIFAPCAACATCGSRSAGWAAWLEDTRGT